MMIVVADDFTGASELAGIALEFGLGVRIQTDLDHIIEPSDVVVIDTNSRSLDAKNSLQVMNTVMQMVQRVQPSLLYKKTDSVLRGNTKLELESILKFHSGKSVLLVPANPSMGRTIQNGRYYVHGIPIHESVFSKDPEYPAQVADVIKLVDNPDSEVPVHHLMVGDTMEPGSIYIPDTTDLSDITFWAGYLNEYMIAAGAADFFRAILIKRGHKSVEVKKHRYDFSRDQSLIVCGSSLSTVEKVKSQMLFLKPRIAELIGDQTCSEKNEKKRNEISEFIIHGYSNHQSVVLLVNNETPLSMEHIHKLPYCLAEIVHRVLQQSAIGELFIEGGTSSSAIVRRLGWNCFEPTHIVGDGTIRMAVKQTEIHLTVKPGSYKWPQQMWKVTPDYNNNELIINKGS